MITKLCNVVIVIADLCRKWTTEFLVEECKQKSLNVMVKVVQKKLVVPYSIYVIGFRIVSFSLYQH